MRKKKVFSIIENRINVIEYLLQNDNLKIAIWGFGLTGKAIFSWVSENLPKNNQYYIIDSKEQFFKDTSITFILESDLKDNFFLEVDIVLPSQGIKIKKEDYFYDRIIPELDLFFYIWKKNNLQSIVITGSIGKSSLTTMIHYYLSFIKNKIICGNIGFPVFNFLNREIFRKNSIAVIECSDSQLKHCVLVSPTYFLITNFYQNHLNYHGSYDDYITAKLTPIFYQCKDIKKIIINKNVYLELKNKPYFSDIKNKLCIVLEDKDSSINLKNKLLICRGNSILYKGKIILSNIPKISFHYNWGMLIYLLQYFQRDSASLVLGRSYPKFPSYRLEKIFENTNIIVYNDSKSTIMESTENAIYSLQNNFPDAKIILLIGGLSKGVNRIRAIEKIIKLVHSVILFGQEAPDLFCKLPKNNNLYLADTLEVSTKKSIDLANTIIPSYSRVIILFSPGGSSFDLFASFEERGKKFTELINTCFIHNKLNTIISI